MSSKHQNINFAVEKENVGSLSMLDLKICRKNGKFVTSVYRKPTEFTPIMKVAFQCTKRKDFYTHYFIGVFAYVVILRHFILKLIIWRISLKKNNYPLNFIDSCIKSFLNKLYTPKVVVPNVPKRNVFVKLSFLGSTSCQIRKKLQKLFSDKLTSSNLKIFFTSPIRVKSFFTF